MPAINPFSYVFFNDTATTEIYTRSLHDALPICAEHRIGRASQGRSFGFRQLSAVIVNWPVRVRPIDSRRSEFVRLQGSNFRWGPHKSPHNAESRHNSALRI